MAVWGLRTWLVATAQVAVATVTLAAQASLRFEQIPIVRGAIRDTKQEALLLSASPAGMRQLRVYRIPASIEGLFRNYLGRLGGSPGPALDSPSEPVTHTTPITYYVAFHSFEDECMDSVSTASAPTGAGPTCQRVRRGLDKKKSLENSRLAYGVGQWIEHASFTWFRREPDSTLLRLRVDLRDMGLSSNWKRHTPLVQFLLESVVLERGAP